MTACKILMEVVNLTPLGEVNCMHKNRRDSCFTYGVSTIDCHMYGINSYCLGFQNHSQRYPTNPTCEQYIPGSPSFGKVSVLRLTTRRSTMATVSGSDPGGGGGAKGAEAPSLQVNESA